MQPWIPRGNGRHTRKERRECLTAQCTPIGSPDERSHRHTVGEESSDTCMGPRGRYAGALRAVHGRKRVAHTVQQEFAQRGARDGATRGFAQTGVLQARHCPMDRTRAGDEGFRQWLVTLLWNEEQAQRDSDIERT